MNLLREIPAPPPGKTGWPWTEETDAACYDGLGELPKISIVTPSYNQGQFLEETIRSILLQNYPNLEYVIIDGGSTDDTVEVIRKYEKWIRFWVSEKDRGQSHAINKGMSQVSGEIVNWINSDDYLTKEALLSIVSEYSKPDFDAGIIAGAIRFFGPGAEHASFDSTKSFPVEVLLNNMPCPQPSSFFLKKYFDSVGGVNEKYSFTMDYDLYIRILLRSDIAYVEKVISNYRLHDASKTVALNSRFLPERTDVFGTISLENGLPEVVGHLERSEVWHRPDGVSVDGQRSSFLQKKAVDQTSMAIEYLSVLAEIYFNQEDYEKSKALIRYIKRSFSPEVKAKVSAYRRVAFKTIFPTPLIMAIRRSLALKRRLLAASQ